LIGHYRLRSRPKASQLVSGVKVEDAVFSLVVALIDE